MTRACTAIALSRATAYRQWQPPPRPVSHPRRPSHRRLSLAEHDDVLELLDSDCDGSKSALAAAFARHPERFVRGLPTVTLPPERVVINPLDPDHESVTADRIIKARDAALASLWTPAPRPSTRRA